MHTLTLFACIFAAFLGLVWLWALTDVGQRVDWSPRARVLWAMCLVFLPITGPFYATFLCHSPGLRRSFLVGSTSFLVLGGWVTYAAWQDLRGEFRRRVAELRAGRGGGESLGLEDLLELAGMPAGGSAPGAPLAPSPGASPRPRAGSRNAAPTSGGLDPAKPPEVFAGRRPTRTDPPTPRPVAPELPEKAFTADQWSPPDLEVLAFTGARPRWARVALDGTLDGLGDPLPEGVRVHASEVGGGAAWVIWKDRLALVDRGGGSPLPLPAPEDLPPVLYPRDLAWLPGMGALLVLARNGGFYMQPSEDATPARWRHMGAFARRDIRALAFEEEGGRLFGVVQRQAEITSLVRLSVAGEVMEEIPLVPSLASRLRTEPGGLQLRWAAGGLLLLRPGAPVPGAHPSVVAHWIDPDQGLVYRPVPQ